MRIITWNVRGASKASSVWKLLLDYKPDIVLLQEVRGIPDEISKVFACLSKVAMYKDGKPQRFSTAVLVKGKILGEIALKSDLEWVNRELDFFKGNFLACKVELLDQAPINVVSVHNPAWHVDKSKLRGIDASSVRLKDNPEISATEIIWSALKNTISKNEQWVVGGDYNSSETFDHEWQEIHRVKFGIQSYGNKEIIERMYKLGFTECLREYNKGEITPTFRNSRGKIEHQMDKLFVTNDVYSKIRTCFVGDQAAIFGGFLSDHLPIITDFRDK